MAQITTRLAVPDIHCLRCEESIEGAVGGLDGVAGVDVDVAAKVVTVSHDPARASAELLVSEVEGQGYDVAARDELA
jgi:copper chaperone CopZ